MTHPAKILIVDDEPFNVDYLRQELEDLGYETMSAANGQAALERVAAEAPDLILLDVMMPVMDGFTTCRILKANEATQLIPIVIMTVLSGTEERIKGIEAGADDFLTKPVDQRELLARIQTAVKLKQAVDRRLKGPGTGLGKQGTGDAHALPSPATVQKRREITDTVFRREGEYWTIAYQGTVFRVRDTLGLRYLASLLGSPHRPIHVLELVASVEGPAANPPVEERNPTTLEKLGTHVSRLGDAGEILDSQAKAAYKHRLEELQRERAEAQAGNDLERGTRVQQEIDFLTAEIISGVGLGGRDRRAASAVERARVNVTRAIKAALQRLSAHHPALGLYLSRTINTGTFCSYTPDMHLPSPWKL
ncbi:MAG: response regulator [Deltaproteobacteria bacterium]|nr:response regulator [Deltaproteobacteria bacterium]